MQKLAAHLSGSMNAYRTEPFEYVERDLVSVLMVFLETSWTKETCRHRLDRRNRPCRQVYCRIMQSLMEKFLKDIVDDLHR